MAGHITDWHNNAFVPLTLALSPRRGNALLAFGNLVAFRLNPAVGISVLKMLDKICAGAMNQIAV
jgi:hypothetical protein